MLSRELSGSEQQVQDQRLVKAKRHFDEGMRQAGIGQWVSAAANLKLAVTFAPGNAEYAARFGEAEQQAARIQSQSHFKRGEFEERAGRFEAAARCFEQAAKLQPTATATAKAAEMFIKIRELKKAEDYGIKAVGLDPSSSLGHLVLAQVFREIKQFRDAKQSLERVMELDPQNKSAQALLKEVQKLA
jgi:tetratricopeptide (TPR) repeat protein